MLYKQAYNLLTKQAAWYDDPDTLKRIGGGAAGALLGGGLGALRGKGTAIAGALGGGAIGTAAGDLATGDNSYIRRVISGKGKEPAVVEEEEVVTTEEPAPAPAAEEKDNDKSIESIVEDKVIAVLEKQKNTVSRGLKHAPRAGMVIGGRYGGKHIPELLERRRVKNVIHNLIYF